MNNVFENIGSKLPQSANRTPMANRRRGAFATLLAAGTLTVFGLSVNNASHAETVCTTTDGAATVWENGENAAQDLREKGATLDVRQVTHALGSTAANITVCIDRHPGAVGEVYDRLVSPYADITPSEQ